VLAYQDQVVRAYHSLCHSEFAPANGGRGGCGAPSSSAADGGGDDGRCSVRGGSGGVRLIEQGVRRSGVWGLRRIQIHGVFLGGEFGGTVGMGKSRG